MMDVVGAIIVVVVMGGSFFVVAAQSIGDRDTPVYLQWTFGVILFCFYVLFAYILIGILGCIAWAGAWVTQWLVEAAMSPYRWIFF